jgi:hypothetical protein
MSGMVLGALVLTVVALGSLVGVVALLMEKFKG